MNNDEIQIADGHLKRAINLAKLGNSMANRIAISNALFGAYKFYGWAHLYQHAEAVKRIRTEFLQEAQNEL